MQFIEKLPLEPPDWGTWFTVPPKRRSFDYKSDYSAMTNLVEAKRFLLTEQHGLCAYCQSQLSIESSSFEHVIPKSQNLALSTCYHNLVLVCKKPPKDIFTNKEHCDKERQSYLLPTLIFHEDSNCTINGNPFFNCYVDGTIDVKHNIKPEISTQVVSFIEILNLNHFLLKEKRANGALKGILDAFRSIAQKDKKRFLRLQFERILKDKKMPYRQFILTVLAAKIG